MDRLIFHGKSFAVIDGHLPSTVGKTKTSPVSFLASILLPLIRIS